MRTAQTVLTVIQERGKQHKPIERVYKLLFNRDFYLNAYAKLYPNNGAMTKGVTDETVDGMSIQKIDRIIELLREEKYQWKPARREYIPKKNGKKRPLGIPTWGDKLLQEVMREILEAYYEPQFSNHSHGFRPNRGCHTALQEIQIWKGTRWFIEGDISKYFDTIDHDVLLKILEKNIHDGRFLRLIANMLKAGYLDDWKFNQTISGTPQGGVISPLLANIYLNEFDQWIENTLIPQYTKGKRQKSNPAYNRMNAEISKARKNGDIQTAHKLEVERRNIPSVDPYDENYRRCRYVRYADDFLIGFTGSKADAEEIKAAMHNFLKNELHLELSQEKTLITNASSQAAKFLGYEIKAQRVNDYIDPKGRRGANGAIALLVPAKVIESNYVEFLPISEHPCDESWGYQNTGFFALTSRYGTPAALMELIDLLHQNEIGVILDFVPVHFAVDEYALVQYDGSALYEYPHKSVGISEWGSYNFMHSRGEVRSFLQSAANYWLTYYHFDGLRMDAISRMIYWQGDEKRGVNGNALDFLKRMNAGLKQRHKGCMLIAEDSTNYPGVPHPAEKNGLGFDYKWGMGWMHDTLEYFQLSPAQRTQHYHKLTFSMMYFRNERYLLPYSHDEVVHGKATILQKMNGQYAEKFPQARAMYLYMMVHPGKKMNFMGNEIGQLREWDEKRQQDWGVLKYPAHDRFYRFIKDLNAIYLTHPALYEQDYQEDGFRWIDCHQEQKCVYAIERQSSTEDLTALFNFSDQEQVYDLPLKAKGVEVLLNTEWEQYGGKANRYDLLVIKRDVLSIKIAAFSGMLLRIKDAFL